MDILLSWCPKDKTTVEAANHALLKPDAVLTIGRSESASIHIEGHGVSRTHALIERSGENIYITDTHSTNGVFLAGKPVKREKWVAGQQLELAEFKFFIQPLSEDQSVILRGKLDIETNEQHVPKQVTQISDSNNADVAKEWGAYLLKKGAEEVAGFIFRKTLEATFED